MIMKRWVYVTVGTLAWLVPVAGVQIVSPEFRAAIPDEFVAALSWHAVALLTYPAGVLGVLAALPALFFGIVTPIESLLISGPMSVAAGYLQWFVVIPRLFDPTRRPPPSQKNSADDTSQLDGTLDPALHTSRLGSDSAVRLGRAARQLLPNEPTQGADAIVGVGPNNGRQLLLAARTEHSRSTGTDGLYGVAQLALSSRNASACTVRINPDFTSRVVKEVQ